MYVMYVDETKDKLSKVREHTGICQYPKKSGIHAFERTLTIGA
jgi:hypothetical protein